MQILAARRKSFPTDKSTCLREYDCNSAAIRTLLHLLESPVVNLLKKHKSEHQSRTTLQRRPVCRTNSVPVSDERFASEQCKDTVSAALQSSSCPPGYRGPGPAATRRSTRRDTSWRVAPPAPPDPGAASAKNVRTIRSRLGRWQQFEFHQTHRNGSLDFKAMRDRHPVAKSQAQK